jgi:hypothetical protein
VGAGGAVILTIVEVLMLSAIGGALAVAANRLVERYPSIELLLWAGFGGALGAVIFASIWRPP